MTRYSKESLKFEMARQRRVQRRKIVAGFAGVVVLITALILMVPALSMTRDAATPEAGFFGAGGQQVQAGGVNFAPMQTFKAELKGEDGAATLLVTAEAPEGALPEGAEMRVAPVTDSQVVDAAKGEAQASADIDASKSKVLAADISFVDAEGNEVEPGEGVLVKISAPEVAEISDQGALAVVHVADDLQAKTLESNEVTLDSNNEEVAFEASEFSVYAVVYTVDFEYSVNGKMYQFSLPGGGFVSFTDLVEVLGIIDDTNSGENGDENGSVIAENAEENTINEGAEENGVNSDTNTPLTLGDVEVSEATRKFVEDVASVECSSPELVDVSKVEVNTTVGQIKESRGLECEYSAELTEEQIEEINAQTVEAGDWALISVQPFTSEETLTVTMKDGETFTIRVTDAQIRKTVIDAKGDTWEITVTYGEDSQIPDGAELKVEEILSEDSAYETYLQDALTTAGIGSQADYARFFDISIWYNGEQVEPADPVSVSIKLADAPAGSEESLKVVHFEESGLQVMDLEKTVEDETGMTEMQFTTESFSVYGVIVEPGPSGVNDLDGRTFTISIGGRYMTEDQTTLADSSGTTGFSKTTTSSEAAKWRFEQVNGDTYKVVSINSGKYLTFNKNPNAQEQWNTRAHATLSDTGSVFTVENVGNGYRFSTQIDGKTYYLDEHNGASGPGFAGWYMEGNNNVLALNFTPPLVENNGEYAVIIEHNGNYYCVQNDGSLMPVQYSVENNVAYVSMANPVLWTYVQENGNWNLRIPTQAATFDYQDLPNNYYYRYIDPNVASGISEELNVSTNPQYPTPKINEPGYNQVVSALNQQHTNYVQNCAMRSYEGNVIRGYTNNYIGIDQTTMKIKGNVSQGEAATVYFARVERVPPSANLNNTVNHIDISIEGGASLSVPLAYGTYYYYVNGEQRTLTVDSDMTLKLKVEHVDITSDDMKSAEITAYSNRSGIMNDAFYVTGYTQNHENNISNSAQVRLEGSFKVADLEHTYSDYKLENGQWISLTSQEHNARSEDTLTEEELQARKDNRVFYTVTVKKELTFPWVYEYAPGQTAQLYDAQAEQPLSTTRMVNLSKSFDYWEEGSGSPSWEGANECPPVTWDRDRWRSGHIIWDTSEHAGTGMDFRLSADMNDQNADVVALEITKYLRKESWDGDALHPSATTPVTNQFVVYEKAPSYQTDWDSVINVGTGQGGTLADYSDYSGIHGKSITVGSSGEGVVYDYDLSVDGNAVTAGMYYIKEDENSIPKIILAEDGTRWMYVSTKVETEYVWRGYEDNDKPRHSADGVTSIPEVAGIYGTYHNTASDKDEQLFNGFLEFYVYNIYKPVATDITIKKVDNNSQPLSNAVFELYKSNDAVFEKVTHSTYTWLGENDQFTVPAEGYTLTGLTDGTYQIKEIKPPDGYVITEDTPVTFTVENGTVVEESNDLKNGATYTPAQDAVEDDPDTRDIDESHEAINDTFTIPNPPGAVLPNTGGPGTRIFTILGSILILGAGALLWRRRRFI